MNADIEVAMLPVTSFTYLLGLLFVVSTLIPWVSFGTNNMDSQLWSLVFGVLFLISSVKKKVDIRVLSVFLIIPFVILIALVFEDEWSVQLLRGVGVYSTFAVVFVGYSIFLKEYGAPLKIVVCLNLIYVAVAVLQLIFGSEIVDLIVNVRTTDSRGVTSLAAEPTYFGIFLFFISWWYFIVTGYAPGFKVKLMIFVNFVGIILLAKSSMALSFVMLSIFVVGTYKAKFSQMFGAVLVIILSCFLVLFFLEGTRIHEIMQAFIDKGVLGVVADDASVNSRLADVVLPIHGFVENIFLPGGFTSFGELSDLLRHGYGGFFWYGGGGDVIMSYIGAVLYELGFLGVLYLFIITLLIFDRTRRRAYEIILLFVLLNSSISVGFTIVPMILATFYVLSFQSCRSELSADTLCQD